MTKVIFLVAADQISSTHSITALNARKVMKLIL